MIDCNETKNYLKERNRMCECFLNECEDCSACFFYNHYNCDRFDLESTEPEKAIESVQEWSDAFPQKTILTEFLRNYPNAEMNSDGFPSNIVPCNLGLIERKDICKNRCLYYYDKGHPCYDCWNTPIKESEE